MVNSIAMVICDTDYTRIDVCVFPYIVIKVLSLSYYVVSYFPGGSTGLKFLSSSLTSTVMACFGR